MSFILGKKLGMNQIFSNEGNVIPVTVIEAGPCKVIQIKTKDKDGYDAVQIGYGFKKKINKPQKGHLNDLGNFRHLKEFKENNGLNVGDEINVSSFKEGEKVKVIGLSKGKGFQGVVKRHGFGGGPASHGHKDNLRAPGSIGSTWPQRVIKGMRMAGRMGGERITVRNLKIAKIDVQNNVIALEGAVPGFKDSLLEIISLSKK